MTTSLFSHDIAFTLIIITRATAYKGEKRVLSNLGPNKEKISFDVLYYYARNSKPYL